MKKLGLVLATIMMCFLLPLSAVAKESPQTICNSNEWEVLRLVNEQRMAKKLQPVSTFNKLQSACDVRANEIIKFFSHTRPNGKTCYTALAEKKIPYYCAGENIAAGQRGPAAVMTAWMNSPGHKANILYKSFNHMGVGYQEGGSYVTNWVQLFVGGCTPTEIKVCGPVSSAKPGMTIEQMGLYLEIKCSMNHGVSYCPISSKMCSGYNKSSKSYQTVTVSYQGKKTTFTVGKIAAPNQVKETKIESIGKASAKFYWTPVSCDGYEVYMKAGSASCKLYKTIASGKTKGVTLKSLKSNTSHWVKVRAYRLVNGKKKYGKWSTTISFRTK